MGLIAIDKDRCRQDGICADVCPAQIIVAGEEDDYPALVPGGEDFCIRCGHCVAVCPHGAIRHGDMPIGDFPEVESGAKPTADQVIQFMRSRRSIRNYKSAPVPRETLTAMIDLARHAPSGHNRQPVRWTVIQDAGDVQRMAGLVADWMQHLIAEKNPTAAALHMDRVVKAWGQGKDRICRQAPHLIVASADKADRTGPAAATIALTYLELAAHALGVGTCWAGYFNMAATMWPPLKAALDLPPEQTPLGTIMAGYARYRYQRLAPRRLPVIRWQ
ncbi:MAG: nitroreductase family protein [Desulfobacterales bacterium]|nr:nitroreductase family protein [Desulfobacterales bacterium]